MCGFFVCGGLFAGGVAVCGFVVRGSAVRGGLVYFGKGGVFTAQRAFRFDEAKIEARNIFPPVAPQSVFVNVGKKRNKLQFIAPHRAVNQIDDLAMVGLVHEIGISIKRHHHTECHGIFLIAVFYKRPYFVFSAPNVSHFFYINII